jgi:C4-dicarboxylate transporter DctM subunit
MARAGGEDAMTLTILVIFVLVMLAKIPISFCLAISSALALLIVSSTDPLVVVQRMYGSVESFSLIAIPFFILAGGFMDSGGISRRLIAFASSLAGHIKGGLAIISVLAAMFFLGVTGSAAADTAAIGSILIPAMEKKGYGKDFAASVLATAGSIGIVTPPSIPMVLLGATVSISIGGMFLGGIIPGILIGIALMLTSWLLARARGLPSEPRATWGERWSSFRDSILALMTVVIIMGGILTGIFTATEASIVAAVYAFCVGLFIYRELHWKDLPRIVINAIATTGVVVLCIAAASSFGWILAAERAPEKITAALLTVTSDPFWTLMLMNALMLLLGTFLDIAPIIIVVVPIIWPIAQQMGIDPIHFGVMVIVNMAIGQVTPPTGPPFFIAVSIAKCSLMEIWKTYTLFTCAMIVVLVLVTAFPVLITGLPAYFMGL